MIQITAEPQSLRGEGNNRCGGKNSLSFGENSDISGVAVPKNIGKSLKL